MTTVWRDENAQASWEGTCIGFCWIGQDMAHCDRCGKDITEHTGMAWRLSDDEEHVRTFEEMVSNVPLFAHCVTPLEHGYPFRYQTHDPKAPCGKCVAEGLDVCKRPKPSKRNPKK